MGVGPGPDPCPPLCCSDPSEARAGRAELPLFLTAKHLNLWGAPLAGFHGSVGWNWPTGCRQIEIVWAPECCKIKVCCNKPVVCKIKL